MRIAVFGTGGVGGYFGARLAKSGEEVIFIARGEHLRAIQTSGLRVDSIQGDFVIRPAQASADPAQVGPVDAVLVGVKAWQVPEAAEAIRPMAGPQTCVLPLQNGVEAPEQLAKVLGAEAVLGGLCQISAHVAGPGHIRHVGIDPLVAFGELDGRVTERVNCLRQAFERAGVNVQVPADINVAMWVKFLFIAAVSGVGAVTRFPIGVFRSIPETRRLLVQTLEEIALVGRSRGVALPEDAVAQRLAFIDSIAPEVTASMVRDILAGRPSELEAQNGAVVRMAAEAGLDVPANRFIYASLLPQELMARGQI